MARLQGQFTFLSGQVCPRAVRESMGVGLRSIAKEMGKPPDPTETQTARLLATAAALGRSQQRS